MTTILLAIGCFCFGYGIAMHRANRDLEDISERVRAMTETVRKHNEAYR